MIAIDFETFYSRTHSVSDMGPWAYAHHPDTDIYMVSVVGEGIEFVGHPSDFDWAQLNGKDLVSHNAAFDMVVARAGITRGIIPEFTHRSWSCSADLAAYCDLPRNLAGAVKELFGHELPKVMRNWMSGKSWQHAVDKGKDKQLLEYALNDSRWCLKLWETLQHNWPVWERTLSAHTRLLALRGVTVDLKTLDVSIKDLTAIRDNAGDMIPWSGAKLSLPNLRDYCALMGIQPPASLAKDSEECMEWEDRYGDTQPWIGALRDYRRTNMLLRRLETLRMRVRQDGTVPVNLKYWGAHTGRWSGDTGLNLQNMPRSEMFGVQFRHLLIPRPGHKFVICDLSQIEPRVLLWLAKDTDMLARIEAGEPLYEAHARATMGWEGGKLKDENPLRYQLAKARVLGLGYGCGAGKFVAVAKAMAGVELTLDEAKSIVTDWRASNKRITRFWSHLGNRLQAAAVRRADCCEYPLPSGRFFRWFTPVAEDVEDVDHKEYRAASVRGGFKHYTWGGRMTENVVQALSRDIFADQLLRIERSGIPIIWHVHDEVIAEVPEDRAEDALATITQIMATPPEWIPDIPLSSEGVITDKYQK